EQPAVAWEVLSAEDGAVVARPLPARLVLAGPAVPALGADVPALERLAVEEVDEALVVGLVAVRPDLGAGEENQRQSENPQRADDAFHGRTLQAMTGMSGPQDSRRAAPAPFRRVAKAGGAAPGWSPGLGRRPRRRPAIAGTPPQTLPLGNRL